MKIAATYENGQIFQHFGHSEYFKLYEIEGGKALSFEVISTNGTGHGALANLLKERGVSALLCGGIGGGAVAALGEAGIAVYGGLSGNADEAAEQFAKGQLKQNAEANCTHHAHSHEEDHSCGGHTGGCGEHCKK